MHRGESDQVGREEKEHVDAPTIGGSAQTRCERGVYEYAELLLREHQHHHLPRVQARDWRFRLYLEPERRDYAYCMCYTQIPVFVGRNTELSKHCVHEVDVEVTANGIVDEPLLRLHLLSLVAEHHIIIPPTPSFDMRVPTFS